LEGLLKSKAWLWKMVATAVVVLILAYAAFLFPSQIWKIALVTVGWYFFGHSMSLKRVTLVSVTSSSGQPERVPWGRRGAAQLGMLTFTIGVVTQQWYVAVMGIVYSYLTAAAMWQNLRARLPYLFDPSASIAGEGEDRVSERSASLIGTISSITRLTLRDRLSMLAEGKLS
jgi:hypothetical protein